MLADPITLTVNAVPFTLNRTGETDQSSPNSSVYATSDLNRHLRVSHQTAKIDTVRSLIRSEVRKVSADPLNASISTYKTVSVYLVIEHPTAGFSTTEIDQEVQGFKALLTTSLVGELMGGEV